METGDSRTELLERLRSKRDLPPAKERERIRKRANASLRDVGGALGVSHTLIRHWELGGMPSERLRGSYADLLNELRLLGGGR